MRNYCAFRYRLVPSGGARWGQDGAQMGQQRARMGQEGAKMGQNRAGMAPKWVQKSMSFHFYVEKAVNAKNTTKQNQWTIIKIPWKIQETSLKFQWNFREKYVSECGAPSVPVLIQVQHAILGLKKLERSTKSEKSVNARKKWKNVLR